MPDPTDTLRPLSASDASAWRELLDAVESADATGEHDADEDLVEELADPGLDPARDTLALWRGGRMEAYAVVTPRAEETDGPLVVHLEGAVRPEARRGGLGGRLLELALARAREQARERALPAADVRASALLDAADAEALLRRHGFGDFRFSFDMACDLTDRPDRGTVDLPACWTLTPYAEADAPGLLAAHNEAFADYPGFSRWTEAEWRVRVSHTRNLAPAHTSVVRDAEAAVAAYLIAMEYDAHTAATGRRELYVAKLGTVPRHRGRGLGTLLLTRALDGAAADGYAGAALDVDSRNPSGALGIYQRAGFAVRVSWRSMRAVLDGAVASVDR